MRFEVMRVSDRYSDDAPCAEATKAEDGSWGIEVADLNELMMFIADQGKCVLNLGDNPGEGELIIYDDFIE